MGSTCPFCAPDAARVFHEGARVLGVWDGFAVAPGHALLVTKRHVETWFDATPEELHELADAVGPAREKIRALRRRSGEPEAEGFNVGVNIGEAAGQTVMHLHVHVIPRVRGDVADPRGGVRGVIPDRQKY